MKLIEIKTNRYLALVEGLINGLITEGALDPTRGYGSWLPADPSKPTYYVNDSMGHSATAERVAIENGELTYNLPLYTYMFQKGYIRVVHALHVGYVSLTGRKEDIVKAMSRILPVLRKHEVEQLLISVQHCAPGQMRCTSDSDDELSFNLLNQSSRQSLGMFLDAA